MVNAPYLLTGCWRIRNVKNINLQHTHGCIFMPPPLGAGGIMFSGCPSVRPSVRPKPEIPSFDLYMGPLVHQTNRNRFTACPSVRPSVCLSVRLSVRPSGEVSGHLPENAWREWPEILHADVSWWSPELISLWPQSVDFSNFSAILTYWNGSNLGFPGISRRMYGGNGLKFCTLMYLDHLQNSLVYGHGPLIFFHFWRYFDLVKRVKFGVSGHFAENAWRKWPQILHADVSWPPSELISF